MPVFGAAHHWQVWGVMCHPMHDMIEEFIVDSKAEYTDIGNRKH